MSQPRDRSDTEMAEKTIAVTLVVLYDTDPMAFLEAVEIARDPSHVPFGNAGVVLRELRMLSDDGVMHDVTREVINKFTEGFELQ